jgi:hypothetical protein
LFYTYTKLFSNLWSLLMLGLAVWAAWWTYHDAKSRNMISWLWAVVSLIFFPLGFAIYLGVRYFSKPKNTA